MEHALVLGPRTLHPPLHATSPFGLDIQLACAVCTGTNAAVIRAKVAIAIATVAVIIPNLVVVFAVVVWFIFYLLPYNTLVTLIYLYMN
jgi:hypothetical protein